MAGFGLVTTGVSELASELDRLSRAAAQQNAHDWWVGTIVEYAIYPEFGTRFMLARPAFREAIRRVSKRLGLTAELSPAKLLEALIAPDQSLVALIAFELEREVKIVIREMGLILTGNLRGSYAAGPSLDAMAAFSESRATRLR